MNISDFCHAIEKPWYDRPAFRCDNLKGIALRFASWSNIDDYNGNDWEDGEPISGGYFYMIGDDRLNYIEIEDIEIINDDEFCGSCGQIGCGHS